MLLGTAIQTTPNRFTPDKTTGDVLESSVSQSETAGKMDETANRGEADAKCYAPKGTKKRRDRKPLELGQPDV